MREILKEIKKFLAIEKNYYKCRLQELRIMTLKEKWKDLKLSHIIRKIIKTEEEKERRRLYFSLVSLMVAITVLVINLWLK